MCLNMTSLGLSNTTGHVSHILPRLRNLNYRPSLLCFSTSASDLTVCHLCHCLKHVCKYSYTVSLSSKNDTTTTSTASQYASLYLFVTAAHNTLPVFFSFVSHWCFVQITPSIYYLTIYDFISLNLILHCFSLTFKKTPKAVYTGGFVYTAGLRSWCLPWPGLTLCVQPWSNDSHDVYVHTKMTKVF